MVLTNVQKSNVLLLAILCHCFGQIEIHFLLIATNHIEHARYAAFAIMRLILSVNQ